MLKFNSVRLEAGGPGASASFSARFEQDLIIIRGGNTSGKSLLVQSLLYSLGLDDLFASQQGTLTRAMTSEVDIEGVRVPVRESFVEVVVENRAGVRAMIRRAVATPNQQGHQLVRVWPTSELLGTVPIEDRGRPLHFYVNRPGGASSEKGFHSWLATFLGWELPAVARYDASDIPLYVQEPLALSYVDQKRGWGGTVPQVPTKYRIIDPLTQAIGFVLNLDSLHRSGSRRGLDERMRGTLLELERLRGRLESPAGLQGGRVVFPAMPRLGARSLKSMMGGVDPAALPRMEILHESEWVGLDERIDTLLQRRRDRAIAAVVNPPRVVTAEGEELARAESTLVASTTRLQVTRDSASMLTLQLGALHRRLDMTLEERRRYGEILTLQSMGAELAEETIVEGDCPTCHQSLGDVEAMEGSSLTVEQTKSVLDDERLTVLDLIRQSEVALQANVARENALSAEVGALRAQIRALKTDLVRPESEPSIASLQAAVQQENVLQNLQRLQQAVTSDIHLYSEAFARLIDLATARLQATDDAKSATDTEKLRSWNAAFRQFLAEFDFTSASPEEVNLDDRFRPVVDGYDISFQGSASDGIRLRWAYVLSLMVIGIGLGQHAGFCILDEPGQQGVEDHSLRNFYLRAATVATHGQVFLTTSVRPEVLRSWIGGDESFQLVDLGDNELLQPSNDLPNLT